MNLYLTKNARSYVRGVMKYRGSSPPRLSSVTMATSLSEGTRDFLKSSFHMFPSNEILKVLKSKI